MNIVFATTCKNRLGHIRRTLPQNIADNPGVKIVLVDYNDQDGLAAYLQDNHAKDICAGHLVVYQYREPVPFRMAHAKNLAHRLGIIEGGDILVNVDADNFTGPGFGDYVLDQFRSAQDVFLWSRMIKDGAGRLPRGISGRIAVTRSAFYLAGGYDEKYDTHSPDDKDFNQRLRQLGLQGLEIDSKFLQAILHTDKMRYREYPHAATATGEDFATEAESPIANAGNVGCGTVYRNFQPEPIEIRPIPTRVFGIGTHKTATTSLHTAFKMLGFKSGHWERAPWAKAIWREMGQQGRSPTLEQFYCLSDLPIPLLFRQLDRAYPESKFILTIRDEWNWLTSVRKHWSPHHNKYQPQWDSDVFSHKVHSLFYGRKDFDPSTMLERYRRHNAEVLEYFKARPHDLLVMDMEKGSKWKELCGFLNVPMPSEHYPVAGASCNQPEFVI